MIFREGTSRAAATVRPRSYPLRNPFAAVSLLLCLTGLFFLGGCGGGGTTTNPTPTPFPTATPTPQAAPTRVTTSIVWAARSRATTLTNSVAGPASALSAVITLGNANVAGGNLSYTVNRDPNQPNLHTENYDSGALQARPGVYVLTVLFYAGANGQGPQVAVAQASVQVLPSGQLNMTIATAGNIAKVVVSDVSLNGVGQSQTLQVGQTYDVVYSALDAQGNLLATSPGIGFINSADTSKVGIGNNANGSVSDRVVGIAPSLGTTITVSVDGVVSAPLTLIVRSNATISVAPNPVTLGFGLSQTFTATFTNVPAGSTGVTWTIDEGAAGGTLSFPNPADQTTVVYTAPLKTNGVFVPATYHLRAVSTYDPNALAVVPINVQSTTFITILPTNPTLLIGTKQKFTATVGNVPAGQDSSVVWSVDGASGSGTILADGTYTAPTTPGTYTVRATSKFDGTSQTSVVTVIVVVKVVVTPNPVTLSIRASQAFTVSVTGLPPGAPSTVTWSVQGGNANGTITPSGVYTAPGTPGTYNVVATSTYDGTTTIIPVTVVSGNLPVTVN